ncbi:MAG: hypothetical protein KBS83_01230, partial [Lachnospiraceae bacterium]|nr:hypothetical protein [Candidatus Equihabitans merdae]
NDADARVLIRIYMMERFLERVAVSKCQTCSVAHLLHTVALKMPILCHLYSDIATVEESVQNPRIRESKPLD